MDEEQEDVDAFLMRTQTRVDAVIQSHRNVVGNFQNFRLMTSTTREQEDGGVIAELTKRA